MSNVYFHKLINGLAVISVSVTHGDGWKLDRPLQCMSDVSPDGHSELLMFPFIPSTLTTVKEITLTNDKILFSVPVIDSVAEFVIKFAKQYFDQDKTIGVTDVTKSRQGARNEDVMNLLKDLEKSNESDGGPNDDENGGGTT